MLTQFASFELLSSDIALPAHAVLSLRVDERESQMSRREPSAVNSESKRVGRTLRELHLLDLVQQTRVEPGWPEAGLPESMRSRSNGEQMK